jgi:hypothetical protein
LSVATLLTLVVIPVVYLLVDRAPEGTTAEDAEAARDAERRGLPATPLPASSTFSAAKP